MNFYRLFFLFSFIFPLLNSSLPLLLNEMNNHNDGLNLNDSCLSPGEASYFNPVYCAEAEILGPYPNVDNKIIPGKLVIRYGSRYGEHYERESDLNGCTSSYFLDYLSGPDNIGIVKIHYKNETFIYEINSTHLDFSNLSFNNTFNETVNIELFFNITYVYREIKYIGTWVNIGNSTVCIHTTYYEIKNITKEIYDNKTYFVEGDNPLFLRRKPFLGKDWEEDKELDYLIFTNRDFWKISLIVKNKTYTCYLKNYSLNSNSLGYYWLTSNFIFDDENLSCYLHNTSSIPKMFSKNNLRYKEIFEFNKKISFENGTNFSINIIDDFNNFFIYEDGIKEYKTIYYDYDKYEIKDILIPLSFSLVLFLIFFLILKR